MEFQVHLNIQVCFLTTHRTTGERKGPFFIPLYHFHSLMNIQTFICNFAWEISIHYHIFLIAPLVFTRLLFDEIYRLIELPFDWLMKWSQICSFTRLFDTRILLWQSWYRKPVNSNSHRLSPLYYKQTD